MYVWSNTFREFDYTVKPLHTVFPLDMCKKVFNIYTNIHISILQQGRCKAIIGLIAKVCEHWIYVAKYYYFTELCGTSELHFFVNAFKRKFVDHRVVMTQK